MTKISELINSMIQKILESSEWTSANPTHTNTLIQVNAVDNPDFENEIKSLIEKNNGGKKGKKGSEENDFDRLLDLRSEGKKVTDNKLLVLDKKLKGFDKGHIGEINRFTSQQMGNVRQLATDPAGFIVQTFIKKFAKGVGIIAFALIIFEAVKWIISELLKPGRFLDLRFKRDINKEIIAFRRREDQQKLKQGFSNIIITTQPRLRPTSGAQITNTLNIVGGRQKAPDNVFPSTIIQIATGVSLSKGNGGRRGFGGPGR